MDASPNPRSRALPPRRALADDVYDAVTGLLLDGVILAGGRANIESIARELQVSPTPVREALARLESEGLVVKQAGRGYTVVEALDAKGFDDLFAVRLLLEPEAARLAADRVDAATTEALRATVDRMRAAAQAGPLSNEHFEDYKAFALDDAQLHRLVAAASGNPVLADYVTKLRPHVLQYRLSFEQGIADETNDEHDAIVRALEAHDPSSAEAAMRAHLDASRARAARHLGAG
jgi:DNA-binding GntR family transcriptional regulator